MLDYGFEIKVNPEADDLTDDESQNMRREVGVTVPPECFQTSMGHPRFTAASPPPALVLG